MKKNMYKLSAFLMALVISGSLLAQAPQKFNYQGIARDAKGNPMGEKTLSLKLAVLPAAEASAAEYEEVQTVTTNEFGLYTIQIGSGTASSGTIKNVAWETGNKYIRVAIDPQGGTNFQDAGTTQLLSVPYALYADRAGSAKSGSERTGTVSSNAAHVAGDANYVTKFTALNVIGKSQIFDNGTSVGIGTASPVATASMHVRRTTGGQYLYMENPTANSFGSFRMYNDVPANFATFTKYGSGVTGGYTGIASLYPFANILGYGNNGPFLNAGTGNIGFAITKGGTNKLKIHIDAASEKVGIGGNSVPVGQVHFNNTDGTGDTLKITNNTTGHTANDGFDIIVGNNAVRMINRENDGMTFGTNNTERARISAAGDVGIGTTTPTAKLDVNGLIRMGGGSPGVGKLMVSNATGIGSWSTPDAAGLVSGTGSTDYIPKFSPNGSSLANSLLADNAAGLSYNSNGVVYNQPNWQMVGGISFENNHHAFNIHNNYSNWNYLNLISPAMYKGFWLYDSNKASTDSITLLSRYEPDNTFNIGNGNNFQQFRVRMNDGRMGNSIDNAHFAINTNYDTAGSFTSSSSNYLGAGILRAEWTGTFGAQYNDNRAIFGKSKVNNNYGFGVFGEGGYYGLYGLTDSFGSAAVGGYGVGGSKGLSGASDAGDGVYGASNTGNAINANGFSGNGLNAYSGTGRAVYATTDSNQAGVFTNSRSTSNAALHNGVLRGEYSGAYSADYVGVYGVSNSNLGWGIGVRGLGGYRGVYGASEEVGVYGTGSRGVYGNAITGSTTTRYGVYGYASGATTNYAGYFSGTLYATTGTFGTKPFMIDHPLDPANKFLRHSSIESNDMMNMYNGNITTDANGYATVQLPDYFEALNENFKYQLTVIGTFAQAMVKEEISNNRFVIQTNQPNVKVSWQVTGVRHDAVAKKYPVVVEELKPEGQKGKYLEPEAFGVSEEMAANRPDADREGAEAEVPAYDFRAEAERIKAENIKTRNDLKANEALHQQRAEEGAGKRKVQSVPVLAPVQPVGGPSLR